jgi:hypothetical protein
VLPSGCNTDDEPDLAVPVPGHGPVYASLFYTMGRWSATLGVKSPFDRHLAGLSNSPLDVSIEPGRKARFTLRTSFK